MSNPDDSEEFCADTDERFLTLMAQYTMLAVEVKLLREGLSALSDKLGCIIGGKKLNNFLCERHRQLLDELLCSFADEQPGIASRIAQKIAEWDKQEPENNV